MIVIVVSIIGISRLLIKVRERFAKTSNYNGLRKKDTSAPTEDCVLMDFFTTEKEHFDSPKSLKKQRKHDKHANGTVNCESSECGRDYDLLRRGDPSLGTNSLNDTTEKSGSSKCTTSTVEAFGDIMTDLNRSTVDALSQGGSSQTTNSPENITSAESDSHKGTTSEVNDTFRNIRNGSNFSTGDVKNEPDSASGNLLATVDTSGDKENGSRNQNGVDIVEEISFGKYPDVAKVKIILEKMKRQLRSNNLSEDLNLGPLSDNNTNEPSTSVEDTKCDKEISLEDSKLIEIENKSDEDSAFEDSTLID